jgi:hypothetical protein
MPLELSSALSHEREAVDDSEIRQQALEAIYMIVLQVIFTFHGSDSWFILHAYFQLYSILCCLVLRCLD